jgi:YD repeat-containing protein
MQLPMTMDRSHPSGPLAQEGFPLGLNLNMWPMQADFGPRTLDPVASSWALLPPQARAEPGQYISRTTLAGVHDLLTGTPMIQETDLDLPFAGARFRLIRTYSEPQSVWIPPYMRGINQQHAVWDWIGTGWMVNVSPVLLVDAAFSEIQGADAEGTSAEGPYKYPVRRCWFVPDAHYSIPFDFLPDKLPPSEIVAGQEYESPFNVDARLRHNGVWNAQSKAWTTVPSKYYVDVMGGKVTYEIDVLRYAQNGAATGAWEDVPAVENEKRNAGWEFDYPISDAHEPPHFLPPPNPATPQTRKVNNQFGIPGLGLTTLISDGVGHRVEIDLNRTLVEQTIDNPLTGELTDPGVPPGPSRPRVEFAQNVHEKGQIKRVRLVYQPTGGQASVEWLLAFTYRKFNAWEYPLNATATVDGVSLHNPWQEAGTLSNLLPTMLYAVHAYKNPTPQVIALLNARTTQTINGLAFVNGRADVDDVEEHVKVNDIPNSWDQEIRYLYSEVGGQTQYQSNGSIEHIWSTFGQAYYSGHFGLEQLMPQGGTADSILRRAGHADDKMQNYNRPGSPDYYPGALPGGAFSPQLLMTVRRGGAGVPGDLTVKARSLYWYRSGSGIPDGNSTSLPYGHEVRLAGVIRDASLRRLMAGIQPWWLAVFTDEVKPGQLLDLPLSEPIVWQGKNCKLWDFADVLMTGMSINSSDLDVYNFHASGYDGQYITSYLGIDTGQLLCYGNTEQGFDGLVVRDAPGAAPKKYRMYQFLVTPPGLTVPENNQTNGAPVLATDPTHGQGSNGGGNYSARLWKPHYPQDSIFHRPYKWTAFHLHKTGGQPADGIDYQWYSDLSTWRKDNAPEGLDENGQPRQPALYDLAVRDGADLDKPTFVTVVDEIDKDEGVSTVAGGLGAPSTLDIPGVTKPRVQCRRVLWFNRAGYQIREKTFVADSNGHLQPSSQSGIGEEFVYDSKGRKVEYRGAAYGSAAEVQHVAVPTEGLVHVYRYPEAAANASPEVKRAARQVIAEGIKRGGKVWSQGPNSATPDLYDYAGTLWTHTMEREPNDPSKITVDRTFPSGWAEGTSMPGDALVVNTEYTWQPNAVGKQLAATKRTEPGQQINEAGLTVYPVSVEAFDGRGRPTWKGVGYSSSAGAPPGSGDLLTWLFTAYDDRGREIVKVADVSDAATSVPRADGTAAVIPARPFGWTRQPQETTAAPASHLVLNSYYDDQHLVRIDKPQGRRDYYFYQENYPDMTTRAYRDILPGSVGSFAALSLGQITHETGGSLVETKEVVWTAQSAEPTGAEAFVTLRTVTPEYGADGAVDGASVQGQTGTPIELKRRTDQLGLVVREEAPDGTLTRYVRDGLGRTVKAYKGTDDSYWTNSGPPATPPWGSTANMYLAEKTTYGTGRVSVSGGEAWSPDIGQVIASRKFRRQPTTQAQTDQYGTVERSEFDRASRKVVTSVECIDVPTSWTVQWLDLYDRPRFTATFYGARPTGVIGQPGQASSYSALNPLTRFAESYPADLAAQILAQHPALLDEKIYDSRGNTVESRRYRCGSSWSVSDYLSTRSYYDHVGKLVIELSPDGGKRVLTYNTDGEEVRSSVYVQGVEVQRTETAFNDGNAVRTVHWERVADGGGTELGAANAVWTASYTWYDQKKREVASADIGTGSVANTYANPIATPPQWGAAAPQWNTTSGVYQHAWPVAGDTAWSGVALASMARYTLQEYNEQGKVTRSRNTLGVVTQRFYDSLGNQTLSVENAEAPTAQQRRTAYKYEDARLVKVANVPAAYGAHGADGSITWTSTLLESTVITYGADVIDPVSGPVSRDNAVIGRVTLPSTATSPAIDYEYTYFPDGLLAGRKDSTGIKLEYGYDGRARRTSVNVKGRSRIPPWGKGPEDAADSLSYTYDDSGRLLQAALSTSNGSDPVATGVITTSYTYDAWGNLLSEAQALGDGVQRVYTTGYSWEFSPAASQNHNRLVGMTYPAPPTSGNPYSQSALSLQFGYGATTSASYAQGQMATITGTGMGQIAGYTWSGAGRRMSFSRPYGSGQLTEGHAASGTPVVVAGFDRYGRTTDADFKYGSNTIQKFGYTYDAGDNIISERVQLASHLNTLSQHVAYDALDRITQVQRGALDSNNAIVASSELSTPRVETWQLDLLGNWRGNGSSPGYAITGSQPGTGAQSRSWTQTVDARNQIESVTKVVGSTTTTKAMVYDRNGNLVSDGAHYFQYDAFNRLVQVNQMGTLTLDANGEPTGTAHPGPWLVHYTYDAMGRLARRQAPWVPVSEGGGQYDDAERIIRIEEYAYDGLRRISEFFYDPIQVYDGPKSLKEKIEIPTEGWAPISYLNRQYVYGPGDQHGLDEYVLEVDELQSARLLVQDHAGNVTGVLSRDGYVLSQRQYDSTGAALLSEDTYLWPITRVGWQGLFADRLDGDAFSPAVATGVSDAIYQVRNRTYMPELGRFMQRDPNASGQMTASSEAKFGANPMWYVANGFNSEAMYQDGLNLFAYGGANSLRNHDPLGLDYWGDVGEGAGIAWEGVKTVMGVMDPGGIVGSMLQSLVEQYAVNQEDDVEWAMDWGRADGDNTRMNNSWVELSLLRGAAEQFNLEYWLGNEEGTFTGPAVAGAAIDMGRIVKVENGTARAAKALNKLRKTIRLAPLKAGAHSIKLTKERFLYFLARHHRDFFNSKLTKINDFFPPGMTWREVHNYIGAVVRQEERAIAAAMRQGGSRFWKSVPGATCRGWEYEMIIENGRIVHFFIRGE